MVLIFEHVCADFFDQLRVLKNYYRFTNGFLGLLAIAGLEKLRREWLMRKIRTVDKDLFPNHWLIGGALDAPDPHVPGLNLKNKVGCVFPIVVVRMLPHGPHVQFGRNGHRKNASHFIYTRTQANHILEFDEKESTECGNYDCYKI